MSPAGRRPGKSGTREAILAAARERFAERGYERATIRGVADQAGVDPALVHHYFGTKEELFVEAVRPPVRPAEVVGPLLASGGERIGEQVVRFFLTVWDDEANRAAMLALIRSATSNERARELLRGVIARDLVAPLARILGRPDAELRATLAASHLVGMALARYIVGVEPIASVEAETLARAMGPAVHRYLVGEL